LVVLVVVGALALALAGFLSSPSTRTVTVTVVAPPASRLPGTPFVVTIDPAREDHGAPGLKVFKGASTCGTERAAVKHLTDGFVMPTSRAVLTPDQLVSLPAPPVTQNSPRFPIERQLVVIQDVHVIAAKQEGDSDLHVILTTSTGAELNVEAPQGQCDSASPYAAVLAKARQAMDLAMPNVSGSHYTPLNLHATIEGVLFFDVLHGQRGAPNGIELHPVTFFSTAGGPAPPIRKRRGTTSLGSPTTTVTATTRGTTSTR
jgi:hypothetical protein